MRLSPLALLSFLALFASLAGCPQAVPAVVPGASCVASVIADALQGMTVAEIVTAAGPGCVTDAEEVVTILLGSKDPRVAATVAFKTAVSLRAPHGAP